MLQIFKKNFPSILVLLLILSLIPIFGNLFSVSEPLESSNELYRKELSALNSMDKLCETAENSYKKAFPSAFDTLAYTELCSEIIKNRFKHGPLNYTFRENWVAALFGKMIWSHMSSIILSDDILKHNIGLCSQQTIVFMDMLKRKKIKVRSVGLGLKEGPGHFLCEVFYNNSWHLYDVSKEPSWNKVNEKHHSLDFYLTNKESFFRIYEGKISMPILEKLTQTYVYGDPEIQPGNKMILFHRATKLIIYLLPVSIILLLILSSKKKEKEAEVRDLSFSDKIELNEPVKQGS